MGTWQRWNVGESAELTRRVSRHDIQMMASITGDTNPIHMDEDYAGRTPFKKCIAHGLFCEGLISNIIGTRLPGEGTIILNQSFSFRKPVYIDDEITARVAISQIDVENERMLLEFFCRNQNGKIVVTGNAEVTLFEMKNS